MGPLHITIIVASLALLALIWQRDRARTSRQRARAKLFSDHRIKELLITERGLRVVYQLSQAEKSRYLVFRMAEFEEMTVNPDFLRELMDDMHNLRDNIFPRS